MRALEPDTLARFSGANTTLCTCLRLTTRAGKEIAVTDHDTALTFSGSTFEASGGAHLSAFEATGRLGPDNSDVLGALDGDVIDRTALAEGEFDDAFVEIFKVDWTDPTHRLLIKTGRLGQVKTLGDGFEAEFRSLKESLNVAVGRRYGGRCDAELGDASCRAPLSRPGDQITAQVIDSGPRWLSVAFPPDALAAPAYVNGTVTVQAGELIGRRAMVSATIQEADGVRIDLWAAELDRIAVGDEVQITVGCDKQAATCIDRFDNILNFRGFPTIPGQDILLAVPSGADE